MKFQYLFLLLSLFIFSSCALRDFNAGTVHVKYTLSKATIDNKEYENKDRLGNISASIRNVQHPRRRRRWDYNVRLTPSVHFDRLEYISLETPQLLDLKVTRFIGMGNLKFTLHTPIGAFSLTGGFGGTIYKLEDGESIDTIRTREIRRIDLAYTAFLSKRFFILMGPRYYREAYESYVFAFRLGYFWGRAR